MKEYRTPSNLTAAEKSVRRAWHQLARGRSVYERVRRELAEHSGPVQLSDEARIATLAALTVICAELEMRTAPNN